MNHTELDKFKDVAFGKSNRPQTPIRTVVNGVYGAVASFEISNRVTGIESKKRINSSVKPSRKHTRATTLAQDSVMRNTIGGLSRQEGLLSSTSSIKSGFQFGETNSNTLFKLRKYRNVSSKVSKFHSNDPRRHSHQITQNNW